MRQLSIILRRFSLKSCALKCSNQNSLRFLKDFSKLERQNFFSSFDVVLCDCDGVIWRAFSDGIPGAGKAIDFLRNQGKQVAFVTNNSILSIEQQLRKFETCDIEVKKEDIIHPAQSICDYLKTKNFEGLILCLASPAFKSLLIESGFQLVDTNENKNLETLHDLRSAVFSKETVKAVVIDVDFNLTAAKLMRAHIYLKNPECLFIAGAADETIPFGGGEIIGSGPFINVVEKAAKRKAVILGKPGIDLSEMLKTRFKLHQDPRRALFIGDSLTSDIRFAKMCGFQTLLVLSGGTIEEDLQKLNSDDEFPDFIASSIAELSDYEKHINN